MSFGYIVLRHVNSEETNEYWKECLRRIWKVDSEASIVVIDDNSDASFVDEMIGGHTVVHSENEEVGSAELLPYLLLLRHKWFDRAVIVHDSVFFNSYLSFDHVKEFEFLWSFKHDWNKEQNEKGLINELECSEELLSFYDRKDAWKGGFGAMSCIQLSFLEAINEKFKLFQLVPFIKRRFERMAFERIIGILCCYMSKERNHGRFGDLHRYFIGNEGQIQFSEIEKFDFLPVVKCWTARLNDYDNSQRSV